MTDSPVGRDAMTVLSLIETVGWGKDAPTPMAEGLLDRSIFNMMEEAGKEDEMNMREEGEMKEKDE